MATVGKILRTRREDLKLTLDDINKKTSISEKFLADIENEEYDRLPPLSYTTGFVRLYAEAVGLDAGAIASQFKREVKPGEPLPGTEPDGSLAATDLGTRSLSRWLIIAVVALIIIVAFGYYGWLRATPQAKAPVARQPAVETTTGSSVKP